MTEQAQNQDYLNFDFDPYALEAPGRDSKFILKVPTQDKALIIKIVPDPTFANGRAWYRPHKQFSYRAGPNESDVRYKTCMSFFGNRSPENDQYWEYKKKLAELKKLGQGNSTEAKKLETLVKLLYPKEGGWLLVVEPESPTIKAIRVPGSVLHILNGKEATPTKPAIPSLIKTMASEGVSPFDVRKSKPTVGWLRLYKTGEGLATRYHVEPVKHEVQVESGGKTYKVMEYTEKNVHEKILSGKVTAADFPNVVEFEQKFAWTPEECEKFVNSSLTEVPERFLKRQQTSTGRVDETDEATAPATITSLNELALPPSTVTDVVGSDDIPF